MSNNPTDKKFTLTGIIVTIVVTIALVWAGLEWKNRYNWPKPVSAKKQLAYSLNAYKNLQLICAAQEKYKQKDWDNDGQKVYSRYLAHLWTTLDQQSQPILINLIPKKLAFAMGPKKNVDGYFYKDLSQRQVDSKGNTRKNDYTKEWAIAAINVTDSKAANRIFLADNSGNIWMKHTSEQPTIWPKDPLADGWEMITDIQQITRKP